MRLPQIIHAVPVAAFDGAHQTVDNIVNIREITSHAPVAEYGYGATLVDQSHKFVNRQVGSLPRAEHREESKARHGQAIQMVVRMTQQFCRFFRRCVRRNRMVDPIGLRKGNLLIVAVDAGAASEDELALRLTAARLQQRQRSADVDILVQQRLLHGGSDSRARRQVHHDIHRIVDHVAEALGIADVSLDKCKVLMH